MSGGIENQRPTLGSAEIPLKLARLRFPLWQVRRIRRLAQLDRQW